MSSTPQHHPHEVHGALHHSASKRSLHHETVPEGLTCACCWEDLSAANYAEYLPHASAENDFHPHFLPAGYCKDCIEHLLRTQWSNYTEALAKTTCKAEQRRLLTRGKPFSFFLLLLPLLPIHSQRSLGVLILARSANQSPRRQGHAMSQQQRGAQALVHARPNRKTRQIGVFIRR